MGNHNNRAHTIHHYTPASPKGGKKLKKKIMIFKTTNFITMYTVVLAKKATGKWGFKYSNLQHMLKLAHKILLIASILQHKNIQQYIKQLSHLYEDLQGTGQKLRILTKFCKVFCLKSTYVLASSSTREHTELVER